MSRDTDSALKIFRCDIKFFSSLGDPDYQPKRKRSIKTTQAFELQGGANAPVGVRR